MRIRINCSVIFEILEIGRPCWCGDFLKRKTKIVWLRYTGIGVVRCDRKIGEFFESCHTAVIKESVTGEFLIIRFIIRDHIVDIKHI